MGWTFKRIGWWKPSKVLLGPFELKPLFQREKNETSARLPLWALLLVVGVPVTIVIWKERLLLRRLRFNKCIGCGYDLTGNVSGVCSECGEKIEKAMGEDGTEIAAEKATR